VASAPSTVVDAALPPLQTEWLVRLDIDGSVAFVAPPLAAREPRPVIFAVHGAADRAEWACGGWRLASGGRAFVLCPQGRPAGGERYGWASPDDVDSAIAPALRALRSRFGRHVAESPMVYAGFSRGAIVARSVLLAHPDLFPMAIFAEGGYETVKSSAFAHKFRARGGRRVLLLCGGAPCFSHAETARRVVEGAGLEFLLAGDRKAGHNLNERMQKALLRVWPELVAGQPGW
jgi:predicted esterase